MRTVYIVVVRASGEYVCACDSLEATQAYVKNTAGMSQYFHILGPETVIFSFY